jgi:hypothetical protein
MSPLIDRPMLWAALVVLVLLAMVGAALAAAFFSYVLSD